MKEEIVKVFTNSCIYSYDKYSHQIKYKKVWWYVCNEVNNYSAYNSRLDVTLTANSLAALKVKMDLL